MFDIHEKPISTEDYPYSLASHLEEESVWLEHPEEDSYPDGYPDELIPEHAFATEDTTEEKENAAQ